MRPTRIVIFAKAPVPGLVKTRLIPALGAEGAADLAADMLARTVEEALSTGLGVELCGDPDPADWYDGPRIDLAAQGRGGLGERMAKAARRVIDAGANIVLIGTDCPALNRNRLAAAAAALGAYDAVIHPTADGGYALLALRRFDASLFADIAWSTPAVASATIGRIEALDWSLDVRATLRDVDEPEDLALVRRG